MHSPDSKKVLQAEGTLVDMGSSKVSLSMIALKSKARALSYITKLYCRLYRVAC
jgi:hypothetical protein